MITDKTNPNVIKDRIADVIREIEASEFRPAYAYNDVRGLLQQACRVLDRIDADNELRTQAELEALALLVESAPEGSRHHNLYAAACTAGRAAARGIVPGQAAGDRLVAAAAAIGLDGPEVVNTIDSGFQQSGLSFRS